MGPAAVSAMGYQNALWGSDYPHLEGTYGHSQQTLHELFGGIDPAVSHRIRIGAFRDLFPHVAVEMVEVGESTGALAEMLNTVADFYDEENETSLTRFSNLIQPVLLIVMGVVIAGLLLSLYMPLFQVSQLGR